MDEKKLKVAFLFESKQKELSGSSLIFVISTIALLHPFGIPLSTVISPFNAILNILFEA